VGYRWIKGGRAIKYPLVETLHRLDLRSMTIDVAVKNAYSKGGIPLTIEGVANVKLSGDQPLLHNAVERFLGSPREHIIQIVKETLEGNLRGVLATLTPEQVNHDKIRFAQSLVEEADKDLHKLGLTLDNLKIQNVHDDVGYLNCIGRKKRAEQMLTNRIAEAENRASSAIREAENLERSTLIAVENQMKVVRAEAATKMIDARTRRAALIAAEQAKVAMALARAEADIGVYKARIEQVKHQLQADQIQPAEAERRKLVAEAQAAVAPIRETGQATAQMLRYVISAWSAAGPGARDVFVMQKLDGFIDTLLDAVPDVVVDRITVIGQQPGGGISRPVQWAARVEALGGAFGSVGRREAASGPEAPAGGLRPPSGAGGGEGVRARELTASPPETRGAAGAPAPAFHELQWPAAAHAGPDAPGAAAAPAGPAAAARAHPHPSTPPARATGSRARR
jgi:flotillin